MIWAALQHLGSGRAPSVPPGVRVYAIGDIHGLAGLLDRLHAAILADIEGYGGVPLVIYLGDYVDRGDDSAGVLDRLAAGALPGCRCRYLCGNHEATMLDFLKDPTANLGWLKFGGIETLASYGVDVTGTDRPERLAAALAARLPAAHRRFLLELETQVIVGDYCFVHAGIRPGRPLDRQDPADLLWIREPFLSSEAWHGKRIVHGHTIVDQPDIWPNRIGIDTGAYAGGALTCLVLEDADCRFLSVGGRTG